MSNNKCLNIDWLSLYCSCDSDFWEINKDHPIYAIEPLDYGTPQFTKAGYIVRLSDHVKVAHVQWQPRARILNHKAVIIKIANSLIYHTDLLYIIQSILSMHITFLSISRLDLALDFNKFDNGWLPSDLINKFIRGEVRRRGHGQGHLYFKQGKKGIVYNGLQFGSKESDANIYLYNKSLELREVKDKPHIRETWRKKGLDITSDVWRLEVSLKADALKFGNKTDGLMYDFSKLDTLSDVDTLFWVYVDKLFCFTDPNSDSNVSRQIKIPLLEYNCKIDRVVVNIHNCSNITDRQFIHRLFNTRFYRDVDNHEYYQHSRQMIRHIVTSCDLTDWYLRKVEDWRLETPKME